MVSGTPQRSLASSSHDELERVVLHCGVPYHIEVLAVATGALQKGTAILDVGKKVGLCLKDG